MRTFTIEERGLQPQQALQASSSQQQQQQQQQQQHVRRQQPAGVARSTSNTNGSHSEHGDRCE